MTLSQEPLFELATDNTTHVLMPNMVYACGRHMLVVGGHFTVGIRDWDSVDCPDCLQVGQDTIQAEIHRQQRAQA